jgi:hypothetical protein
VTIIAFVEFKLISPKRPWLLPGQVISRLTLSSETAEDVESGTSSYTGIEIIEGADSKTAWGAESEAVLGTEVGSAWDN